jgi:hypothetical protein
MSDNSPSTASGGQNKSNAAQPNQKKQNPVRLLILLLLLLLVASAYGYDRKIAGPACEEGQKIVLELLQQQQSQPGKVTASFAEVQQALAKKPSSRVDETYYAIETYSWRRGSVFQTYFIRVIYRKDKDGTFSVDGVTSPNEEPTEAQLPGPIKPRELTEEQRAAMQSPPSPPTGPSSGPGGVISPFPPGKQGPGTSEESPPTPEKPESNPAEKPDSPAAAKADSAPAEVAPAK